MDQNFNLLKKMPCIRVMLLLLRLNMQSWSVFIKLVSKYNLNLDQESWPCGAMDNASAYGAEDSRFESWQGRTFDSLFVILRQDCINYYNYYIIIIIQSIDFIESSRKYQKQ